MTKVLNHREDGSRPGKKRVRFRSNRAKPARDREWTRRALDEHDHEVDAADSERVAAKGALSRKRTIVVRESEGADDAARDGVVVKFFGRVADVDDGECVHSCSIRRILRTLSIEERNPVAVGDRVRFIIDDRAGVEAEGVIVSVAERTSELKRVVGKREATLVANVDSAIIVTSAHTPKPKPHLVDRYIVSALHGRIEPVVCLNKIDLADGREVEAFLSIYRRLGYKTLAVSAETGAGLDALRGALTNRTSVVTGQSGVGKSSLLNALQTGLALKTGGINLDTKKGRHTTSVVTLLKLDFGGYVVDTPGVKSFDLSCVPRERIEEYFVDLLPLIPKCKFPDCTHVHEIGCAVREGVEAGTVDAGRYESYVRIFTDTADRPGAS